MKNLLHSCYWWLLHDMFVSSMICLTSLSFPWYVCILSATRSVCSAAQELTAEQLEDLLPHCNLGMNCFKQICVLYPELINHLWFMRTPSRLMVKHSTKGLWFLDFTTISLSLSLSLCTCVRAHVWVCVCLENIT